MEEKASCSPQRAKQSLAQEQGNHCGSILLHCCVSFIAQSSKITTTMVLLMNILYLNHSHYLRAFQHFAKKPPDNTL